MLLGSKLLPVVLQLQTQDPPVQSQGLRQVLVGAQAQAKRCHRTRKVRTASDQAILEPKARASVTAGATGP